MGYETTWGGPRRVQIMASGPPPEQTPPRPSTQPGGGRPLERWHARASSGTAPGQKAGRLSRLPN
eukprot:2925213-Pyramimonas_sp.AAC.1